jgi:hypothetical protein
MDTHSEYTRINVTVQKQHLECYRALLDKAEQNVSKLLDDALMRAVEHAKRRKALARLETLEPAFTHVENASSYITDMRNEDRA